MEFGPFTLLTRLGRGGMGEVWKAHGPGPDGAPQTVVLKRILTHLAADADVERSFLREVRLSGRLQHPNIVRVFGGGRVGDELYLTMEYLEGVDLHRLLRALKSREIMPPVALGARIARDVCRALAYAYDAVGEDGVPLRLVHRDVTPTNIMITRDGQVKLLDFGLAKALSEVSEGHTNTGTLKGKFGYMAPEQIDGGAARHQSDQFSIGVVLHEALSGTRLFRGEHDVQTIFNVKHLTVESPSSVNSSVPGDLAQICLRALERDPRARFRTCADMATALDPIVDRLGDPAQLAALVQELFPAGGGGVNLALPASVPKHVTELRPAARSKRRWVPAAIAFGCVIAVGAGALLSLDRDEPPVARPPAPITEAPVAQPAPMPVASSPPAPPPAAPASVAPEPPHARPKATKPQPARVKAVASPKKAPPTSRASTPKTTGEDIRGGAVVDPFAR